MDIEKYDIKKVSMIPFIGEKLADVVTSKLNLFRIERVEVFLKKLENRLSKFDKTEIDTGEMASQNFIFFTAHLFDKVANTEEINKVDYFLEAFINRMLFKSKIEYSTKFLNITASLNLNQIEILRRTKKINREFIELQPEYMKYYFEDATIKTTLPIKEASAYANKEEIRTLKSREKEVTIKLAKLKSKIVEIEKYLQLDEGISDESEYTFLVNELVSMGLLKLWGQNVVNDKTKAFGITKFGLKYLDFISEKSR